MKRSERCPNCGADSFAYQSIYPQQTVAYRCGTVRDDRGQVWTSNECRTITDGRIAAERRGKR